MPSRKFVYSRAGVKEVTPEESKQLCEELHADAASRADLLKPINARRNCATWPMTSITMAVNPEQVPRVQEILRKAGVQADFTKDGGPILTSARHRAAYMKAMGKADPDAGYTGAVPENFSYDDYKSLFRREDDFPPPPTFDDF